MKRPKAHEIDVQARRIFENVLPKEWVGRYQPSDDYGIDYEVEIFDKNESTGVIFKIQLKGTENLQFIFKKTAISFSIPTQNVQYLVQEVQIPTFLILVDISTDKLYWLGMKGNREVAKVLQKAKKLTQDNLTLHTPIRNLFPNNCEGFFKDLSMGQADILAHLISSIDTTHFVQVSKECYDQDEVLKKVRFTADALRIDRIKQMVRADKCYEIMKECEKIFKSPTETVDLRFAALFNIDKTIGRILYQKEHKRIEETIKARLENAKRMRMLCRDAKDRLDLRIYSIAHYQSLKILKCAHRDLSLFMHYCLHKNEKPFWLVFLNIQRQAVAIKVRKNIRRMFKLLDYAIKNKSYQIAPSLITKLCEESGVYFIRLENEGLVDEAQKLRRCFDDAVNLGISIANSYKNYEEIAHLYSAWTQLTVAKEKERRFAEAMRNIEELPEFDGKKMLIEMFQKHLQIHKEMPKRSIDDASVEDEEKIYRSMIEASGIDLEKGQNSTANILRIGLKDLNPGRVLKLCIHRFAKPIRHGLIGEIFKLISAGSKLIYCTKHERTIEGIDLDSISETMNKFYCNKCPDRASHPGEWTWTKKWQLEQNDKYAQSPKR